jgi:hypothetical protein
MSLNLDAGISLLHPFGVFAQRCAAPLPVGETGGSKGKGGGQGGGSPGLHNPGHRSGGGRPGIPWPARGQARDPFRARGAEPLRSNKAQKPKSQKIGDTRPLALCVQSLSAWGGTPRNKGKKMPGLALLCRCQRSSLSLVGVRDRYEGIKYCVPGIEAACRPGRRRPVRRTSPAGTKNGSAKNGLHEINLQDHPNTVPEALLIGRCRNFFQRKYI